MERRFKKSNGMNSKEGIEKLWLWAAFARTSYITNFFKEN
jgi:hypothetical protein